MKQVHGTFNSFVAMAAAMGVKAPKIKEKEFKCPNCGGKMQRVGNSNVFVCPFDKLEDNELHGKPVQVFSKCGKFILAD
jgi:hypothetical protein